MERIRAFIALPLCKNSVKVIEKIQHAIMRKQTGLRPVAPQTLHLTLHFFGDVEPDRAMAVMDRIEPKITGFEKINLKINGLGAFPNPKKARVLWLGVDAPGLADLANRVFSSVRDEGLTTEKRPFRPHLTIARAKPTPIDATDLKAIFDVPPCLIDHIVLFRSTLTPRGPMYDELKTVFL